MSTSDDTSLPAVSQQGATPAIAPANAIRRLTISFAIAHSHHRGYHGLGQSNHTNDDSGVITDNCIGDRGPQQECTECARQQGTSAPRLLPLPLSVKGYFDIVMDAPMKCLLDAPIRKYFGTRWPHITCLLGTLLGAPHFTLIAAILPLWHAQTQKPPFPVNLKLPAASKPT